MESRKCNSLVIRAIGLLLLLVGLICNKWVLTPLLASHFPVNGLTESLSIGLFQLTAIFVGIRALLFANRLPSESPLTFLKRHRGSIRLLILVVILNVWVLSAVPVTSNVPRLYAFGLYRPSIFKANLELTLLAAALFYVAGDVAVWRQRAKDMLLTLGSLVLVIALFEIPAALNLIDYRVLLIPKGLGYVGPHNRLIEPSGHYHRPPHDQFSQKVPGDTAFILGVDTQQRYFADFKYDKNGFRNSRDPSSPVVLLLGDSFIEGYKVGQDRVVSERLGKLLGLEVVNIAQCGFDPFEELAALEHYIATLKPRVVVWFFYEGNDLPRGATYQEFSESAPAMAEAYYSFRQRSFSTNLFKSAVKWSYTLLNFTRGPGAAVRRSVNFPGTGSSADATMYFAVLSHRPRSDYRKFLPDLFDVLQRAKSLCDAQGTTLLFAYIPAKFKIYRPLLEFPEGSELTHWRIPDLATPISQWLQRQGMLFLDLTPALRQAAENGKLVYFLDDQHWSPEGHELASHIVAQTLRRSGLLAPDR